LSIEVELLRCPYCKRAEFEWYDGSPVTPDTVIECKYCGAIYCKWTEKWYPDGRKWMAAIWEENDS